MKMRSYVRGQSVVRVYRVTVVNDVKRYIHT